MKINKENTMSTQNVKKGHPSAALICGILALLLTIAFSSLCVILEITGKVNVSVTAGLVFVGLIFGFIGIFVANMSYASSKSKLAIAGLVFSIAAIMACVYSFILYLDMRYWWTCILNAVAPGMLA